MKRVWSPHETAELRRLAQEGKPITAIADALCRSDVTVRRRAELLGIQIRRSSLRQRSPDVCTHAEREAVTALLRGTELPLGVGQGTKQAMLRKGWIEHDGQVAAGFRVTTLGKEALKRKIPIQE